MSSIRVSIWSGLVGFASRNTFVQDVCPLDPVGHVGLAFDPTVAQLVANALDPAHAKRVICGFGPPL